MQFFNWMMPSHIELPDAYFLLTAMVLGQPVRSLPADVKFDLDSVWKNLFGTTAVETSFVEIADKISLSGDAMITILIMVKDSAF